MPRKHRVAPPEQKLVEGNTPMNKSPSGRVYPMTEAMIEGRKRGGFQKGKSGNPKGRPPEPVETKMRMHEFTEEAIENLKDLARNSTNEAVKFKANMAFVEPFVAKAATKHEHEHAGEIIHTSDLLMQLARARNIVVENEETPLIDITPEDDAE